MSKRAKKEPSYSLTPDPLAMSPDLECTSRNLYDQDMILERMPEVQKLTASEKLVLVSELWDDLASHPSEVPVSRDQLAELDRRMEEYRRDPSQVTTWESIKGRILGNTR